VASLLKGEAAEGAEEGARSGKASDYSPLIFEKGLSLLLEACHSVIEEKYSSFNEEKERRREAYMTSIYYSVMRGHCSLLFNRYSLLITREAQANICYLKLSAICYLVISHDYNLHFFVSGKPREEKSLRKS